MNTIEYLTDSNHKWTIKGSTNYKSSALQWFTKDSGEMTLFLHCSTFLHELFWVFQPESILNMR